MVGKYEGGNVFVSPCGDPAILRRIRLRTASALMRMGAHPKVHWTSNGRTSGFSFSASSPNKNATAGVGSNFESGNVSVSPSGDAAILSRMRLRTACAPMRTGVPTEVHWTSVGRTSDFSPAALAKQKCHRKGVG
jgi:hypothetical protein